MNKLYDCRIGLLGMSLVCFTSGLALVLTMATSQLPGARSAAPAPAEATIASRREAMRILAEAYGVEPQDIRE